MNEALDPHVHGQLERLALRPKRPLVVCDADEVLFAFIEGFEQFLHRYEHYFIWRAYQLAGNIRKRGTAFPVDEQEVQTLLARYWDETVEAMPLIPGAAAALDTLARRADIVILTNVPLEHHEGRTRSLGRHRMPYPTVANIGPKGPALRWLHERTHAPVFFIDDSPRHHRSVAQAAEAVIRLHFVGDRRLAGLLATAEDSHYRTDTWAAARAVIEAELDRAGH
ncbi:MAG: hypothetical protein FJX66_02215 [Alphaproteobacteria bacterium]|nr:hypothetical protein [Alphaproteobacteria bacterium]